MAAGVNTQARVLRRQGAATLRVLAALLAYPDAELRAQLPEMSALLSDDAALSVAGLAEVQGLLQWLAAADPVDAEVAYVELFDRGRATSLHLFEHVHGDSRDRGPAMIGLGQTYASAGLLLKPDQLPDYLPVVLEFLSTQPAREARDFLDEIAHLLNRIFGALQLRASPYAGAIRALLDMAGRPAQAAAPAREPDIDESWAEPAAFAGCGAPGQAGPGQAQPVRIVRKTDPCAEGAPR